MCLFFCVFIYFFIFIDEKKQVIVNVEKQLEEAKELLEQMDLEMREIPAQSRGMYSNRMKSYKQEMSKLEADFKRSRIAYSDEVRNELLGDDGNSSESQLIKLREERAHLLDNTERLERSSRRLEAGYQVAIETGKRSASEQIALAYAQQCSEHVTFQAHIKGRRRQQPETLLTYRGDNWELICVQCVFSFKR
uniref:Vesicle transport v-SNARE N-terminal domain-containing protein n=1 Tax=Leptobrachium leishanense TaxID=445787 RepID=A0A8C5PXH3_9ANUR